jgi:hypothetical protein
MIYRSTIDGRLIDLFPLAPLQAFKSLVGFQGRDPRLGSSWAWRAVMTTHPLSITHLSVRQHASHIYSVQLVGVC